MAERLGVDTVGLRHGAALLIGASRAAHDAGQALSIAAAPVPGAIAGSRTAAAWAAIIHVAGGVDAESEQLGQLGNGLSDAAALYESTDSSLAARFAAEGRSPVPAFTVPAQDA